MFGMPWFTANVFEFVMIFTQPERGPRPITQELAPTSSVGKLAKLHTQAVDNTSTNISLLVVRCLNTFCRVSCLFQCAVVLARPLPRSPSFWPHRLWICVCGVCVWCVCVVVCVGVCGVCAWLCVGVCCGVL